MGCLVAWLLVAAATALPYVVVVLMCRAIDRAMDSRMHFRLAERAISVAQTYDPDSAEYKTAILRARAHARKAGFDNGYTDEE